MYKGSLGRHRKGDEQDEEAVPRPAALALVLATFGSGESTLPARPRRTPSPKSCDTVKNALEHFSFG